MTLPPSGSSASGRVGRTNILLAGGSIDPAVAVTELRLEDGRTVRLATAALLMQQPRGNAANPGSADPNAADPHGAIPNAMLPNAVVPNAAVPDSWLGQPGLAANLSAPGHDGSLVVPVIEERLEVARRTVETAKVRLHKVVHEYETQLDELLAVRSFDVERTILNQPVDTAPEVRQEGDTTIYPLVEEQVVVTRQLVLREELRVTRRDSERHDTRPITLRREVIEVEREALERDGPTSPR